MHSYRGFLLMFVSGIVLLASIISVPRSTFAQQNQRLVESVDVVNNRRLRKDDILYYVQTRPGDPYNEQQVQRDLQAILALGFFDKTKTRVLTEEGARGGINVIFDVTELPIIRDLQFGELRWYLCLIPQLDILQKRLDLLILIPYILFETTFDLQETSRRYTTIKSAVTRGLMRQRRTAEETARQLEDSQKQIESL